jgi:3-phosphoshikimate 1-carboxyvinyltransferase
MEQLKLEKKNVAQGVINLPGSKSLSNRILLLASIAKGQTKISNLLKSDDTSRMLEALKASLPRQLHKNISSK